MIRVLRVLFTLLVSVFAIYTAGFGVIAIENTAIFEPDHPANAQMAYMSAWMTAFLCLIWLAILLLERLIKEKSQ